MGAALTLYPCLTPPICPAVRLPCLPPGFVYPHAYARPPLLPPGGGVYTWLTAAYATQNNPIVSSHGPQPEYAPWTTALGGLLRIQRALGAAENPKP